MAEEDLHGWLHRIDRLFAAPGLALALAAESDFEAEAHRQPLEAAAAARDPNGDEAQAMRELDAELEELADEWE